MRRLSGWPALARDLGLLWFESAEVVVRRSLILARCDRRAGREFGRMVDEKAAALAELQIAVMSGQIGADPGRAARAGLNHVRRKVRANRTRLRR